ncbi:hypothetical protein CH063_09902 [Colletotrichum higginsianum]|nr:hypothetical protein CH063_09902 [Colletotrichum higginsianum]
MFRFKHPNLRQILKKAGVKNMGPVRDPSQLKNRKPGHSLSARASPAGSPAPLPSESINAKPARKPLPGGPSTASPSPGPASLPPKPPPQASPPQASPPPAEGQAPKKVKLVIKKPSSSLPK